MSSANSNSFTSSFPTWMPFLCFSFHISMASSSKIMLNNSGESGHPYLVPDLRGNAFRFFTSENDVCCGFVIYSLYYVEIGSLYAHFLGTFFFLITNGYQILSKAFIAPMRCSYSFYSLMC